MASMRPASSSVRAANSLSRACFDNLRPFWRRKRKSRSSSRSPAHERQQPARIGLQHLPVGVDPLQDDGGHREDQPGRIEAPLRQHMVDQIAVEAAIPILERMDVDEAEGEDRCGEHRIEGKRRAAVECCQAADQRGEVLGPCTDVVGDGRSAHAIMRADEATFRAKAETHEAGIADDDTLQALQFRLVDANRRAPIYALLSEFSGDSLNAITSGEA